MWSSQFPANTFVPGDYRLLAIADVDNMVRESVETNNTATTTAHVKRPPG